MSVLKSYRDKHSMHQLVLANKLSLSQGVLSKFENGLTPSAATAIRIEKALGPECPAEALSPLLAEFVSLYEARRPRGRRRA